MTHFKKKTLCFQDLNIGQNMSNDVCLLNMLGFLLMIFTNPNMYEKSGNFGFCFLQIFFKTIN